MLAAMRVLPSVVLVAAMLLAVPAWSTDVYRWVDSSGQEHYSDQWRPGAEKIRIQDSPVSSSPPPAPATPAASGKPAAQPGSRYASLEIASPAQEEVLWNIEGQLRVALQVTPTLQPGHGLRLLLDGQEREVPEGSTEVRLTDVFRGMHILKAQVVDDTGRTLIESPERTFTVRQTSLANPSRPAIP